MIVWPGSDPFLGGSGAVFSPASPVVLGTRPVPSTLVPLEQALLAIGVSGPEYICGHCPWVWSPADVCWQHMCQSSGKQVHLQRSQPLVDLVEDCWAQHPV